MIRKTIILTLWEFFVWVFGVFYGGAVFFWRLFVWLLKKRRTEIAQDSGSRVGFALSRLRIQAIRTQAMAELARMGLPATDESIKAIIRKLLLDAVDVKIQRVREDMKSQGEEITSEQIAHILGVFLRQYGVYEQKEEYLIDKAFREA